MLNVRNHGFGLIELMVATTLSLILLAALLSLYTATAAGSHAQFRLARLNHELHAIAGLIRKDLRRAGYWAADPGVQDALHNPFVSNGFELRLGAHSDEAGNSCVLLAYDLNRDGLIGVGSAGPGGAEFSDANVEQFGFRLHDGAVEMRSGGATFDCNSGSWQDVSTSLIQITRLEFDLNTRCLNLDDPTSACMTTNPEPATHASTWLRSVVVTLEAQWATDPQLSSRLETRVRLRNDAVYPPAAGAAP